MEILNPLSKDTPFCSTTVADSLNERSLEGMQLGDEGAKAVASALQCATCKVFRA